MDDFVIKVIAPVTQVAIGLGTIAIAIAVYILNRNNRRDAWLQRFSEMHDQFWSDERTARVRAWIASDTAYEELRVVLVRRKELYDAAKPLSLTMDEYKILDALDFFVHLNIRCYIAMHRLRANASDPLWRRLFVNFWLGCLVNGARPDLTWYIKTFSPKFHDDVKQYFDSHSDLDRNISMKSVEADVV